MVKIPNPKETYSFIEPPKHVGAWDIGGHYFCVNRKPTDQQIRNTESLFGWTWVPFKDGNQ